MDRMLRAFVASRSAASLPEDRRVDLRKVRVRVFNHCGAESIEFLIDPRHVDYGVKKAVHLLHDVLMDFLRDSRFVEDSIDHVNPNSEPA
jgi:hypothetical protein